MQVAIDNKDQRSYMEEVGQQREESGRICRELGRKEQNRESRRERERARARERDRERVSESERAEKDWDASAQ